MRSLSRGTKSTPTRDRGLARTTMGSVVTRIARMKMMAGRSILMKNSSTSRTSLHSPRQTSMTRISSLLRLLQLTPIIHSTRTNLRPRMAMEA
jgi:hypothetical protein